MPLATKEAQREYQRKWIAKRRADFFVGKYCVKCGSIDDLELDHIDPSLKVTHSIWSWSEVRRLAEIAKCQILCHNCHIAKTFNNLENLRGEENGFSKLTTPEVLAIRLEYSLGNASYAKIATKYHLSRYTVRDIIKRKVWQHI